MPLVLGSCRVELKLYDPLYGFFPIPHGENPICLFWFPGQRQPIVTEKEKGKTRILWRGIRTEKIYGLPQTTRETVLQHLLYPETTSFLIHQGFELQPIPTIINKWLDRNDSRVGSKKIFKTKEEKKNAYLNKTTPKIDATPQIISLSNVAVEGLGIKLSKDVNFINATINAITHWYVYQPIATSNWYLSLPWRTKRYTQSQISGSKLSLLLNQRGIFKSHSLRQA